MDEQQQQPWVRYAERHGHVIETCRCVGCMRHRGETPPPSTRPKRSRVRGYIWLTDVDDLRVRRAAQRLGMTNAEFCRQTILARVIETEET